MAALRAAVFPAIREKPEGGHFLPPPPSSARASIVLLATSRTRFDGFLMPTDGVTNLRNHLWVICRH